MIMPDGLMLNKKTGEIYGMLNNELTKELEIICRNVTNVLVFRFIINVVGLQFCKNDNIIIGENKKNTLKNNSNMYHSYLNIKMVSRIHHIKIKISGDAIWLGCTSNNNYEAANLHLDNSACSIYLSHQPPQQQNTYYNNNSSSIFGNYPSYQSIPIPNNLNGNNGEKVNDPHQYYSNGECDELIFNMKEKTFSVIFNNNNNEILLFKNIQGSLYPFVLVSNTNTTAEIIDYFVD